MSGFVVAGLIREDHAALERGGAELGNARWAFVYGQVAADTVAGAMIEIEARNPQILARKRIELRTGGAVGEYRARNCDVAFEHAGEAVAHLGGRLADD